MRLLADDDLEEKICFYGYKLTGLTNERGLPASQETDNVSQPTRNRTLTSHMQQARPILGYLDPLLSFYSQPRWELYSHMHISAAVRRSGVFKDELGCFGDMWERAKTIPDVRVRMSE